MTAVVPSSCILHPGVHLASPAEVGEFVILGQPPAGASAAPQETHIGPGALIRSHTVVYAGNRIGARFQTGHGVLVREHNEIGDDVSIGSHSIVEHHVRIGSRVRIHSGAFVPEHTVLEDDCWIGPHAVLTNARYPRSRDGKAGLRGPRVGAHAKIGANATLLPGVVVGAGALVGAGAVVVRDVPPGKVVVGNPARVVRDVGALPAYADAELLHGPG